MERRGGRHRFKSYQEINRTKTRDGQLENREITAVMEKVKNVNEAQLERKFIVSSL